MKNIFIAFEGVDGAGKTTLARMVSEKMRYKYLNAVPDELISVLPMISNTESPLCTFNFFGLCNAYRSLAIKHMLKEGSGAIIDRYIFSTFSYHRLMLGYNIDSCIQLYKDNNILLPDVTFFVTASKEVIAKRINKRENDENKKQWYGDTISLSLDIVSSYEMTFSKFNLPFFHLDTSDKTPDEGVALILKYIENFKGLKYEQT